jgi:integrase
MIEVNAIKDKNKIEKIKKFLKEKNLRNYCLFVLGINIGLRISDLLELRISDVLNENKIKWEVTINEKKTGKTRTFKINKQSKKALLLYLKDIEYESDSNHYIFRSRKCSNKHISRNHAWVIINEAAKHAGIHGRFGTHTLRKTFGYWSYRQGIDITLLQKIFNHSSPAITLKYIGITQDEMNEVYTNLNL